MNVLSICGSGYVGIVSGVCFANLGNQVIFVDIDNEKVQKINSGIPPIFENNLKSMMEENKERISATTSLYDSIQNSDITFLCVGTPSKEDGTIELSYIKNAAIEIGKSLKDKNSWHLIVVKSTVLPGTSKEIVLPILEEHSKKKVGEDFGLAMNPEFLREGNAVKDFLEPDRIIIGSNDKKSKELLREIYKDFSCPIVQTSLSTAEMIKYASNCFLATKISYINEIGNMCKSLGIDTYEVADGIGLDKRIGRAFLDSGIGWGGSCFPKDLNAMLAWAKKENKDAQIIKSVIAINNQQPSYLINLLKKHIPNLKGKTVGILGLAFKSDTDDIRESRSIPIVKKLIEEGSILKAFDPKAMDNFKNLFPDINYCTSAEQVLDSDAVIITTGWNVFEKLDYKNKIVIDGRRIKKAEKEAYIYEGVCW